jgi:cell division protein FtsX
VIAPKLASALRRGGRIAVERPRVAAWALVAATCAMFVAGAALLAADAVERAAGARTHANASSLVVYLGDGVTDASAHVLATQLEQLPGVERAELVPAAESAHRLERSLGADAALLDGVDLASLPSSVEVTLAPGVRDVLALSPTIRALRGTPGVADVVLGPDAPTDPQPNANAQDVAWGAAAVLGVLAIVVVLASLRMRLQRERREREVYDLLGASPAFSIMPTALAGALHGAAAAVLAALALVLGLARYGDQLPIEIALPAASALFVFVALGAALGFVGGGLAAGSRAR